MGVFHSVLMLQPLNLLFPEIKNKKHVNEYRGKTHINGYKDTPNRTPILWTETFIFILFFASNKEQKH